METTGTMLLLGPGTMAPASCATEPAGTMAESVPDAAEAECAPTGRPASFVSVAELPLGHVTAIVWTRIGNTSICMRVHGALDKDVDEYVVAGIDDATWKPGQPITVTLWPAPAGYAGSLPRIPDAQVFGAGDVWALQPPHWDAGALGAAA